MKRKYGTEDDEEQSDGANKRVCIESGKAADTALNRNIKGSRTNLDTLPPEIFTEIFRHLRDPHDLVSTTNIINSLYRTNRTIKGLTPNRLKDGTTFGKLAQEVSTSKSLIRAFPYDNKSGDYNTLQRIYLSHAVDRLPLDKQQDRDKTIESVLKVDISPQAYSLYAHLIENIEFSGERGASAIVDRLCGSSLDNFSAISLTGRLIAQTEFLSPEQISKLAAKTDQLLQGPHAGFIADSWYPHIDKLTLDRQSTIVDNFLHLGESALEDSSLLQYFDKIKLPDTNTNTSLRDNVFDFILSLPPDTIGYSRAMQDLSRSFPILDESKRHILSHKILELFDNPIQEPFSNDEYPHLWKPEFCRVEALMNLIGHKEFLNPDSDHEERALLIANKLANQAGPAGKAKAAQLLPIISDPQRRKAIFESSDFFDGISPFDDIVLGLSQRIKHMNSAEKSRFTKMVARTRNEEIIKHVAANSLGDLPEDNRSKLVRLLLNRIEFKGGEFAEACFPSVARAASLLAWNDVQESLKAARNVLQKMPIMRSNNESARDRAEDGSGSESGSEDNWDVVTAERISRTATGIPGCASRLLARWFAGQVVNLERFGEGKGEDLQRAINLNDRQDIRNRPARGEAGGNARIRERSTSR